MHNRNEKALVKLLFFIGYFFPFFRIFHVFSVTLSFSRGQFCYFHKYFAISADTFPHLAHPTYNRYNMDTKSTQCVYLAWKI